MKRLTVFRAATAAGLFSLVMGAGLATADGLDRLQSAVVRIVCKSADKVVGSGTGFIVSPAGYILTNYHVIENCTEVHVSSKEIGADRPAVEIDRDRVADIALLKISSAGVLPCATLGTCEGIEKGTEVYAVGFPLGAQEATPEPSLSKGVVSAVTTGGEIGPIVETDAAIDPGVSGGPLALANGDVIGISTLRPADAAGERPGFAISIDTAITLLALNRVEYVARLTLAERILSPRSALYIFALALVFYVIWSAVVIARQGWRRYLECLPSRMALQCLIASVVVHLTLSLLFVLWEWIFATREVQPFMDAAAENVKVLHVAAAQPQSASFPTPVAPGDSAPRKAETQTEIVKVEDVDDQSMRDRAAKRMKDRSQAAAEQSRQAQEDMKRQADKAAGEARDGIKKGQEAAQGIRNRLQEVLDGLGKADAATEERRARWAIVARSSCFEAFVDHYKGEVATPKADAEGQLVYLSNISSARPVVREGIMRNEKRMRWVCDRNLRPRNREIFERAGRPLGPDPIVLCFFPQAFEDELAALEKDHVTRQLGRKFDPNAIGVTVFHHDVTPPYRVWVKEVRFR